MRLLGIESSADDTSIAVLEIDQSVTPNTFRVLSHLISSQIELHRQYGGIFPAMAKREHARNILPLLKETMSKIPTTNTTPGSIDETYLKTTLSHEQELHETLIEFLSNQPIPQIDAICVTTGPGLEPTLWVGINVAKVLAHAWKVPIVPVNHMEGHLLSPLLSKEHSDYKKSYPLQDLQLPTLALLISGGHTELVLTKQIGDYTVIGQTRDDAVGEAFDKVARLMNLPYPGGPEISKLAEQARSQDTIGDAKFPRPMIHSDDYDFSFSGLKTAVRYFLQAKDEVTEELKKDISREFEDAVAEVLISKTSRAIDEFGIQTLLVGGGVANNKYLQEQLTKLCDQKGITLHLPQKEVTTDNALMITLAGYFSYLENNKGANPEEIRANGNLAL